MVGDFKVSRSDNNPIVAIKNKNIFKILYSEDNKIKHDSKTKMPPEKGTLFPLFRKVLWFEFYDRFKKLLSPIGKNPKLINI